MFVGSYHRLTTFLRAKQISADRAVFQWNLIEPDGSRRTRRNLALLGDIVWSKDDLFGVTGTEMEFSSSRFTISA